jgi:hypothetical protein
LQKKKIFEKAGPLCLLALILDLFSEFYEHFQLTLILKRLFFKNCAALEQLKVLKECCVKKKLVE